LFDGDRLVRSYPIQLGSQPVGDKQCLSDGRTPEGAFRITMLKYESQHHRFLGIDYPNMADARRGRADGLITDGEYRAVAEAHDRGVCPPWNTALGGGIGVHGTGPAKRDGPDWTAGCVAVSNAHIEELVSVLRQGDPVEILP
jgi:murein L,D-transpeptidase YafK